MSSTRKPSPAAVAAVIGERCKELKLPTVPKEYEAVARRAQDDDWGFELFLAEVLEREVLRRRENIGHVRIRRHRDSPPRRADRPQRGDLYTRRSS